MMYELYKLVNPFHIGMHDHRMTVEGEGDSGSDIDRRGEARRRLDRHGITRLR
jgi:hypothetical protein